MNSFRSEMTSTDQDSQNPNPQAPSRRYSNYVLGVLVLVYVFNFIDRQILSILAEDIRADLGIDDAQPRFPLRHRVSPSSTPSSAFRSAVWPTCGHART